MIPFFLQNCTIQKDLIHKNILQEVLIYFLNLEYFPPQLLYESDIIINFYVNLKGVEHVQQYKYFYASFM